MKVEGVPKMENAAKEIFEKFPPNCSIEDKFVFFVDLNNKHIGVVDLVFGHPKEDVAFIGLLLLDQQFHGQGLGKKAYELIEKFASLFTDLSNPTSNSIYQKIDYTKIGQNIHFDFSKK